MFLRFEATMNGAKFSSIAEEVILRDIVEQPATVDTALSRIAGRPGQRLSAQTRTALSVRLVYNIRSRDIARRSAVRDLVAKWARDGGMLEINSRPGKHLYVVADAAPALDSSLKWMQDLSLTLTAYEQPYWVDNIPAESYVDTALKNDGSGDYASSFASLTIGGTVDFVPVNCTITNVGSKTLTRVKIEVNNTHIELSGMSVDPGGVIMIEHIRGILMIYNLMDSAITYLYARTPQSSDELLGKVGYNNVNIESNSMVSVALYGAGWWL